MFEQIRNNFDIFLYLDVRSYPTFRIFFQYVWIFFLTYSLSFFAFVSESGIPPSILFLFPFFPPRFASTQEKKTGWNKRRMGEKFYYSSFSLFLPPLIHKKKFDKEFLFRFLRILAIVYWMSNSHIAKENNQSMRQKPKRWQNYDSCVYSVGINATFFVFWSR